MSGNDTIVNLTPIHPDAPKRPLTNGQIAAITIGTTFVFFLTMMMAVCVGEYWKYLHGKKKRHLRRQRHAVTTIATMTGEPVSNQLTLPGQLESSISQSDYITSSSLRDSDSSGESSQHRHRHSSAVESPNIPLMYNESCNKLENSIEIDFDESLDRVKLDCVETCDDTDITSDVATVPLILRQCDDGMDVDVDGEILCDSVDSRDQFQLEADV